MKNIDEPHEQQRVGLKKTNSPGNYLTPAPRCGAKTRGGTPCQGPAMKNGRCRLHGGLSTGPKTPEGLSRSRVANWKHGKYSAEKVAMRKGISALIREGRELVKALGRR
jgi:hypothetical protein